MTDVENDDIIVPKFTKKEYNNYIRQKDKCIYKSPEEEYKASYNIYKICCKCNQNKKIIDYKGNTSGTDAFDKKGLRLRRPECNECSKNEAKGKNIAKQVAKKSGISYEAPEGTKCSICNKLQDEKNKLVFDHCHKNNTFRGYCCNSCNRSLGVLGDDVEGLIKALNYLLKSQPTKLKQNDNGFIDII
jgi:hypothetical protein